MSATPTVLVAGEFGLAQFSAQVLAALIGAGAALFVYWRSSRAASRRDRHAASVDAAGQLLLAVQAYDLERHGEGGFSLAIAEMDAYRRLRVAAAIHVPRLQDAPAQAAVRRLLTSLKSYGPRSTDGQAVEGSQIQRETEAADHALVDYLEQATSD